jgi:hypothetical protein
MTSQPSESRRKLKAIVGRAERIDFPEGSILAVPAKIDTGAFRSSVWASDVREEDGHLVFKLLGPESPYYSGQDVRVVKYEVVDVENSFGHSEKRYSISLKVRLGSKSVRSNFTLADRSKKTYPVLIGRKLLRGRYVVDVAEGQPLEDEESMS